MYSVSSEYSNQMRLPVREAQAHAKVFLGLFDRTASDDAVASFPSATDYSAPNNIKESINFAVSYATFEGNGFRLDGKQSLLPSDSAAVALQSFIGEEVSDASGGFINPQVITFDFKTYHDMIGVTLGFDPMFPFPKGVVVKGYSNGSVVDTINITTPVSANQQIETALNAINKLEIEIVSVVPNARARLNYVGFGLGYTFTDKQLVNVLEKHQGSPVSLSLPTSTFEFTLYNEDNMFGVDNKTAISSFLEEGQQATVDYTVTWGDQKQEIPGGVWMLKTWTVDKFSATFQLENRLSQLINTMFLKGVYDEKPHSLKELAVTVFEDAGVLNYYVDPYLETIYTTAPIPNVTHAEALQLIANAGRAMLYVDREGIICLKATVAGSPLVTSPTEQTPFSNPQSVFDSNSVEYMTFERNFAKLDGSQRLISDDNAGVGGWIALNGARNGEYPENELTLHYLAPTDVYSLTIDWGSKYPATVYAYCKVDGTWQPPVILFPSKAVENYELAFKHCTDVKFELIDSYGEDIRPRIVGIRSVVLSDFVLNKDQVFEDSQEAIEVKLRNVNTNWIKRYKESEATETPRQKVKTNSGVIEFAHNLALDPIVKVERNGEEATDIKVTAKHYAYTSYITLESEVEEEVDLYLKGFFVTETEVPVVYVSGKDGQDQDIVNPLFDSKEIARDVADWVGAYYKRRVVYDYNTRGFPELEYGDTIYLDGVSSAVITSLELSYNGAFNGSMRMRR